MVYFGIIFGIISLIIFFVYYMDISIIKKRALKGNRYSQYLMGCLYTEDYEDSFFIKIIEKINTREMKNERIAIGYFLMAAKQGHIKSQYTLGVKYSEGRSMAQDDVEAVKWCHLTSVLRITK